MRLIKLIFPLALLAILCISFFSCSKDDNPIVPNNIDTTLDEPRFNWKMYQYPDAGFYGGVWAKDTDNVFAVNTSGRYIINMRNGLITQIIYPDFAALLMTGVNENTAFLFGVDKNNDSTLLKVKKWTGESFQDIKIDNKYSIFPAESYFHKEDEIWLVDSKTHIYKFNGRSVVNYKLNLPNDTNCYVQKIFFDSTVHKLRAVVLTNLNPSPQDIQFVYFIYDFDGTNWNKFNEFRLSIYDPNKNYVRPCFINGYILNKTKRSLSIYNNSSFNEFLQTYNFNINLGVSGFSKSNLLVEGTQPEVSHGNKYYLFHWNGKKWSKEFKGTELAGSILNTVNEKTYLTVYNNGFLQETTFLIGIKK